MELEGCPEDWEKELFAAGWSKHSVGAYMSPGGIMYRGPAHALKMKRSIPELTYLTMEDIEETRPKR